MAKDIIFADKPKVRHSPLFPPTRKFTPRDATIVTIDAMMEKIENVKSARIATEILWKHWGRDYSFFIVSVIKEQFPEVPHEEISHYLVMCP